MAAGVFLLGVRLPGVSRPCRAAVCVVNLTFLWPVAVCADGPLQARAMRVLPRSSGAVTGSLRGGGVFRRKCGGPRP